MAATAGRTVTITYSGDVVGTQTLAAASNAASVGSVEIKNLALGANTITVPSGTATGCTIVPPSGNAVSLTLKGISGDTGIRIHNTDPTSMAIDSSVTSFILTTGAIVNGIRFFWS